MCSARVLQCLVFSQKGNHLFLWCWIYQLSGTGSCHQGSVNKVKIIQPSTFSDTAQVYILIGRDTIPWLLLWKSRFQGIPKCWNPSHPTQLPSIWSADKLTVGGEPDFRIFCKTRVQTLPLGCTSRGLIDNRPYQFCGPPWISLVFLYLSRGVTTSQNATS